MKKGALLFAAILWAGLAWGQYGYQYMSGGYWFGAQFIGQEGWMVGAERAILHTTDGGRNWLFQTNIERDTMWYAPTNPSFNDVFFTNSQEGWACVNDLLWSQYVWHTTDGGRFWQAETLPSIPRWPGYQYPYTSKIYFTNPRTGWIIGGGSNPYYDYGNILATTNGGQTWAHQDTSHGWSGVWATDANHCWSVGNLGWTARTTNGGATWNKLQAGVNTALLDVCFLDSLNGWACGEAGTIIHTADGGVTWTSQPSSISEDLYRIRPLTPLRGNAIGEGGIIVNTTDGGASWFAYPSTNTTNALTAISYVDSQHGWIIGEGGTVLETTDGGWDWVVRRQGTAERLQAVSFVNEQNGWAASWEGNIWHTGDSGKTWQPQDMVAKPDRLQGLAMANGTTGWAVGKSGLILATQNGGTTWFPQAFLPQAYLKSVFAADPQHAWACGSQEAIVATSNGGQTWREESSWPDTSIDDISFRDPNHGWVLFQDGHVLRTVDKGQTWAMDGLVGKGNWYHLSFVDSLWGWAVGDSGVSLSIDGGKTWIRQVTGATQRLRNVKGTSRQKAWAVGDSGKILVTSDSGATWNLQPSPVTTTWRGVDFADSLRGVACGNGYIINTNDGGITWVQRSNGYNLYAITLIDSLEGWAVGIGEQILHSTDGGVTWHSTHSGSDSLRAVCFINRDEGWAGGGVRYWWDGAKLLHTTNRGISWTTTQNPGWGPIYSLSFVDSLAGWYGTGNPLTGRLAATTDRGQTWTVLNGPWVKATNGAVASPQIGAVCGNNGLLLRTTDGATWALVAQPHTRNLWGVAWGDAQTAWGVGSNGLRIATTDQGYSWRTQKDDNRVDSLLMSVQAFDGLTARATGYLGRSVLTTDGGTTWVGEETGTKEWLLASSFLTPTLGWVVGENGMVLKYGRLPYGVEEEKGKLTMPLVTSLGQNRPNPFAERTEIMYQLANKGKVRLVVYNVLGQAVRRLVDREEEPGSYVMRWDGRDDAGRSVSSGVYFYRLETQGKSLTRKMVKVR